MKNIKTYFELEKLKTFKERFEYLQLNGQVGKDTFGFDRIFNQRFYRSREWRACRDFVIMRDNGCDLGIEGHEIQAGRVIIHHMNPILLSDIENHIILDSRYRLNHQVLAIAIAKASRLANLDEASYLNAIAISLVQLKRHLVLHF